MADPIPPPVPQTPRRLEYATAGIQAHLVAGAKALRRWQDDTLVTDAELAAAVAEVLSIRIG